MAAEKKFDFQVLATTLMGVVEKTLKNMCSIKFSDTPEIKKVNIMEFEGLLRVSGMDKFNGPTYISTLSFYRTPQEMEKHKACGALVLYIEESEAGKLLKSLGYSDINDEDEESVMEFCGEFCNVLAGNFKKELSGMGYVELTISSPGNYHNEVPLGVDFSFDQFEQYEMDFFIKDKKALILEVTLAPIPYSI